VQLALKRAAAGSIAHGVGKEEIAARDIAE